MSELQVFSADGQDIQQSEQPVQPSAGALLKQAREATGLHIAALAVLLKVPVKKLEALEANRLDLLPDAVFIRALASSVCRSLKIDPAPVLSRLPQTDGPRLTYQGLGINSPLRFPADGPGPGIWAQFSKPAVLAGFVLLIGALVLILLPAIKVGLDEVKSKFKGSRATNAVTALSSAEVATMPPEKPAPSPVQVNGTGGLAAASSTSGEMPSQTSSGGASLVSTGKLSLNLTSSASSTASGTAQIDAPKVTERAASLPLFDDALKPVSDADVIVFTAKGQSWVEATDAKGQIVLRRMLKAGDAAGATGALPMKVVIGRANETEVQIRGKSFDLNAVAKDNVARFEVK